jgi:hypothetical protein
MALASLFTHETDYIYKIRPEHWRLIIEGVARGIATYGASSLTLDEGMAVLRATRTSTLRDAVYDVGSHTIMARFDGEADRATGLYVFAGNGEEGQLHRVPAFAGQISLNVAC